ncbi:MAG: hypothetical protein EBV24_00350 [Actinobacteria bacterium]|nr:hypothetical protein [Actinomycetota bacterium]
MDRYRFAGRLVVSFFATFRGAPDFFATDFFAGDFLATAFFADAFVAGFATAFFADFFAAFFVDDAAGAADFTGTTPFTASTTPTSTLRRDGVYPAMTSWTT